MACGTSAIGTGPRAGTPSAPGAISIPTDNLSAFYQCMVNAGWEITAIRSTAPGQPAEYDMVFDGTGMDPQEAVSRGRNCSSLRPASPTMTEQEIRDVYYRWVGEYDCLVGLGYHPDSPPSVEVFVASWGTGPWMPINGVDTAHWSQAQYDEAKSKCTLEFYTKGF